MKKMSKCALRNAIEHGGIAPREIIGQALREDPGFLMKHIEPMFLRGLTAEQLLKAENDAIDESIKRYRRDAIVGWHSYIFDILIEYAEDTEVLNEMLVDFVYELYEGGDSEERDGCILMIMAEFVRRELTSIDDAVDYIACIANEVLHDTESDLRHKEYVRSSLASVIARLNVIDPLNAQ